MEDSRRASTGGMWGAEEDIHARPLPGVCPRESPRPLGLEASGQAGQDQASRAHAITGAWLIYKIEMTASKHDVEARGAVRPSARHSPLPCFKCHFILRSKWMCCSPVPQLNLRTAP